jgi:hypothetical protein
MFTSCQRFIALNIDVHIGIDRYGDLMHPIGSAAMLRCNRGQARAAS